MRKKALLFTIQSNIVEELDQNVVTTALKLLDYDVTALTKKELVNRYMDIDFSTFDAIFFPVQFNAMFSSTKGYYETIEKLFQEAKDGSLYSYVCDTTLAPNPYLWKANGLSTRQNLYAKKPVTFLACFKDAILKDNQAMQRINGLWMKKSHPKSRLLMLEWTAFHFYCQNALDNKITACSDNLDDCLVDYSCNLFYYGGEKPKIAKRLKEMGLGENPDDFVFGAIGKLLPNVRQIIPKMNINGYDWKKYVQGANKVLFPYEPIKGDYQITLRMLECLKYYKDKVLIDEKLSKDLIPYLTDIDVWKKTAEQALDRFQSILNGESPY